MNWYHYVALVVILSQLLFIVQACKNYRYVLVKYKKKRLWNQLKTVLIVPCKGLDAAFERNIASFFDQDYGNFSLWFVVGEREDPAYPALCELADKLSLRSKAQDVRIFVAGDVQRASAERAETNEDGPAQRLCSQKVHNLLYCYERIGDDIDVLAFADSDISVRRDWLSHLVWPLRQSKNGVATGYRWFIPKKHNLASLALSAVNAKVVQLLGNTRFNQVWGGSMAIRTDVFRQLGLDKVWTKALSDDLTLGVSVKKTGKKVVFVPACLSASYESTTWPDLLEFGRRQFLITRVTAPRTWWFGLCSSLYSVLGLWLGAALTIYAVLTPAVGHLSIIVSVPVAFLLGQLSRAIMRQRMAKKLFEHEMQLTSPDQRAMSAASVADIFGAWAWSLLLLFLIVSSAFGRTLVWRGVRYRLVSPTETVVIVSRR